MRKSSLEEVVGADDLSTGESITTGKTCGVFLGINFVYSTWDLWYCNVMVFLTRYTKLLYLKAYFKAFESFLLCVTRWE